MRFEGFIQYLYSALPLNEIFEENSSYKAVFFELFELRGLRNKQISDSEKQHFQLKNPNKG